MTIPDAVLTAVTAALPGATLWNGQPITANSLWVFDGRVEPTPPERYAVVYVDNGTLTALAVCDESDSVTVRWQVTSVAPNRARAAWVADQIRDNTVDTTLTATGWVCGQIKHTYSQMPQRDEQVLERPVMFMVDLYELLATRA